MTMPFMSIPKKCQIACEELEFFGHWISQQGVMVDKAKIDATINWPSPTTLNKLRGFLGLISYY